MNMWGQRAMEHWREHLPERFAALEDPATFFTQLGEEAAARYLEVRDAALARCAASDVDGAEHLWAALTRETPDPEAAEPAVLLAACALLRGDGALAGIALDRAEQAWPGHRLTRLLRAVWAAGIPPERVRECLSAPEPPGMPVTRVAGRGRRRPPERTGGVLAAARKTIRTVTNTKGARTTPNRVARVNGTVRVLPFTP